MLCEGLYRAKGMRSWTIQLKLYAHTGCMGSSKTRLGAMNLLCVQRRRTRPCHVEGEKTAFKRPSNGGGKIHPWGPAVPLQGNQKGEVPHSTHPSLPRTTRAPPITAPADTLPVPVLPPPPDDAASTPPHVHSGSSSRVDLHQGGMGARRTPVSKPNQSIDAGAGALQLCLRMWSMHVDLSDLGDLKCRHRLAQE